MNSFGPLNKPTPLPNQVPGVPENFGQGPTNSAPIQTAGGMMQVPVVGAGPGGYGGSIPSPGYKR